MNESRIRIFSAAIIQLSDGVQLSIEESSDGHFNMTISDPDRVRLGISEPGSTQYIYFSEFIRVYEKACKAAK